MILQNSKWVKCCIKHGYLTCSNIIIMDIKVQWTKSMGSINRENSEAWFHECKNYSQEKRKAWPERKKKNNFSYSNKSLGTQIQKTTVSLKTSFKEVEESFPSLRQIWKDPYMGASKSINYRNSRYKSVCSVLTVDYQKRIQNTDTVIMD